LGDCGCGESGDLHNGDFQDDEEVGGANSGDFERAERGGLEDALEMGDLHTGLSCERIERTKLGETRYHEEPTC
jgi:hypothetical protein